MRRLYLGARETRSASWLPELRRLEYSGVARPDCDSCEGKALAPAKDSGRAIREFDDERGAQAEDGSREADG